jgi:hypothetical protein
MTNSSTSLACLLAFWFPFRTACSFGHTKKDNTIETRMGIEAEMITSIEYHFPKIIHINRLMHQEGSHR